VVNLSVVSPVYGCEGCLEELADRVYRACNALGTIEIIFVDDASPDQSWDRIVEISSSRPWVSGLRLSRNFGQHSAISAGVQHARGEWVVVMDCDLQDVPEEIPKLLAKAISDDLDVVFAQRISRRDSLFKRFTSSLFFGILSWLTGVPHDASTANFGAYSRKVIDAVNQMPERDRTFPLMVKWVGFRQGTLPVLHAERTVGKSSYSFKRMLKLATGIVLSYSEKPLRLVALAGLAFSTVSLGMVAYSFWQWTQGAIQVAGFTSIMASVWLVGGATMFCLGVVGLYVGQVFRNAQGRPYFFVSETTRSMNRGLQ